MSMKRMKKSPQRINSRGAVWLFSFLIAFSPRVTTASPNEFRDAEVHFVSVTMRLQELKVQYERLNNGDPRRTEINRQYTAAYDDWERARWKMSKLGCTQSCVESLGSYNPSFKYATPAANTDSFTDRASTVMAEEQERNFAVAKGSLAAPDSVEVGHEKDNGVERIGDMEFSNNSLGKAGEYIITARNIGRCGSDSGQSGCASVARSMDSMSTISQVSDYTAYAAVAGVVAPIAIYSGNQKEDQEKVAKIQQVAGIASIGAGVMDIGIGVKARFVDARKLDGVSAEEKARCDAEEEAIEAAIAKYAKDHRAFMASNGAASAPDENAVPKRTRTCVRFSAKAVGSAANKVRDASNSHLLVGGIKTLGGVASLYLAEQAKKRAQNLSDLEGAEDQQQQQSSTAVGLLSPSGVNNNDIGFVEPPPATASSSDSEETTLDTRASIHPESGGSIAPTKRNIVSLPKKRADRSSSHPSGASQSGGIPSSGGETGSIASALFADSESIGGADSAVSFDAGGGGSGFLNAGGTPLGDDDGGFGKMMGSMVSGLLGDKKKGGTVTAGASRTPGSYRGASRLSGKHVASDANIFERVRSAIARQVDAGKVVNEAIDINKI